MAIVIAHNVLITYYTIAISHIVALISMSDGNDTALYYNYNMNGDALECMFFCRIMS